MVAFAAYLTRLAAGTVSQFALAATGFGLFSKHRARAVPGLRPGEKTAGLRRFTWIYSDIAEVWLVGADRPESALLAGPAPAAARGPIFWADSRRFAD